MSIHPVLNLNNHPDKIKLVQTQSWDTVAKATDELDKTLKKLTAAEESILIDNYIPTVLQDVTLSNGSILPRNAFVSHFRKSLSNIVERAIDFLNSHKTLDALRFEHGALFDENESRIGINAGAISGVSEWFIGMQCEEFVRLGNPALASTDKELQCRAISLARMILNSYQEQDKIESMLSNGGGLRVQHIAEIMDEARSHSSNPIEIAASFIKIAIEKNLSPQIRLLTNFDNTIGNTHSSIKITNPGDGLNWLTDAIEKHWGLPGYLRLVTTEFAGLHVTRRSMASTIFDAASKRIIIDRDYLELTRLVEKLGGDYSIVTSGQRSRTVRRAMRNADPSFPLRNIDACNADTYIGDRSNRLTKEILAGPSNIIPLVIVVDRENGEWVNLISKDSSPSKRGGHLFKDLVITCSPTSTGDNNYRLNLKSDLHEPFKPVIQLVEDCAQVFRDSEKYHTPVEFLKYPANYTGGNPQLGRSGEIVVQCREAVSKVPALLGREETLLRPDHSCPQSDKRQYDLGVPSALLLKDGRWVFYYKAAVDPSGLKDGKPHPSYIFAATWDPSKGTNESVSYLSQSGYSYSSPGNPNVDVFLRSSLGEERARDGLHDPRVGYVEGIGHIMIACAFNKEQEQTSRIEAKGDLSKPIQGAYSELFVNKGDPVVASDWQSYGIIGPDYHFKNIVPFPTVIDSPGVNGTKHSFMFLIRRIPGIQLVPAPTDIIENTSNWEGSRTEFWSRILESENLSFLEIMKPELIFEGKGNKFAPNQAGQLAPGFAPIHINHNNKDYWLFVYNTAPDFRESESGGDAVGRVIGATLLDFNDPYKVLARSSLPIVVPRDNDLFLAEEGFKPRHADVAFCGGGGLDETGEKLRIFYTEGDSVIRVAERNVSRLMDWLLKHNSYGSPRLKEDSAFRLSE